MPVAYLENTVTPVIARVLHQLRLEVVAVVRRNFKRVTLEDSAHRTLLGGGHTGLEQPGCAERGAIL